MSQHYWPELIPRQLEYPEISVGDLLSGVCRRFGENIAVVDGPDEITYTQLLAESSAFANALRADGIGAGDSVVLSVPNGREYLIAYLAIQLASAAVSPANPLYTSEGLRQQIRDSGAIAVIAHPDYLGSVIGAREGTAIKRVIVVPGSAVAPATQPVPEVEGVDTLESYVAGYSSEPPQSQNIPSDVAHLAFTGGTTGIPKAVRVLHSNVVGNVMQSLSWRAGIKLSYKDGAVELSTYGRVDAAVDEGKCIALVIGPLYHAHALVNVIWMLTSGAKLIIAGRFRPESMLDMIESTRATYITGGPTMWHALVKSGNERGRDLTSLKAVSSGAAPIDPVTMNALHTLFPNAMLNEGWGLTEGTCVVVATPGFTTARRKQGSVGQPVPDTELEIRDVDGTVLGADAPGELWVRGPQVTGGYLGADKLSAEQYVDGWLRTGDIGYFDDEGFVYISDRIKDMLLYKGYNVYPRELENLLIQHPDVSSAAVLGRDNEAVGQVPVAFVVLREGRTTDPEILMEYVASQVLPYKKVRELYLVEELPTSEAGKILKKELRKQLV